MGKLMGGCMGAWEPRLAIGSIDGQLDGWLNG